MNWYFIQECWSDGHIYQEQQWPGTEEKAIAEARGVLKDPCFQADYVRVLTLDCELVWDSRESEVSPE